jgi:hypothetical protein
LEAVNLLAARAARLLVARPTLRATPVRTLLVVTLAVTVRAAAAAVRARIRVFLRAAVAAAAVSITAAQLGARVPEAKLASRIRKGTVWRLSNSSLSPV